MHRCKWCDRTGDACGVEDKDGYQCTRDRGHTGPHVACGTIDHAIASWDNRGNAWWGEPPTESEKK